MTTIGITGHQRLPASASTHLRARFPDVLRDLRGTVVISSLAEGADQECAKIAVDSGLAVRVIVPSDDYISTLHGPARESYLELLAMASSSTTLPFDRPSEEAFLEAGKHVVDESEVLVAVWDGHPAGGKGGTADVVRHARARGKRVVVIWPEGVTR